MKTMNLLACLFVIATGAAAHAEDAKPKPTVKIANETMIFKLDDSRNRRENTGIHSMHLSPDASRVLYVQRVPPAVKPAGGGPRRNRRAYRLVLRDIKTRKDTILPGSPSESDDFLVAYVSTRPFDAEGKNLVVPVGLGPADKPLRAGRGQMQLGVYSLADRKLKKLDLTAAMIFPSYDAEGKNLIVLAMSVRDGRHDIASSKLVTSPADKIQFKQIGVVGLPRSPCPGGRVLPVLLPPASGLSGTSSQWAFILYDTKSDKQLLALPSQSTRLDDYNPQWTADGRYLYYVDSEKDATPDGRTRHKNIMRIWDRTKGVEHAIIQDVIPVGRGPGKSAMVLVHSKEGRCSVHNAANGKDSPLLGEGTRLINADGRFLLYVKQDKDGTKSVYRAEMK